MVDVSVQTATLYLPTTFVSMNEDNGHVEQRQIAPDRQNKDNRILNGCAGNQGTALLGQSLASTQKQWFSTKPAMDQTATPEPRRHVSCLAPHSSLITSLSSWRNQLVPCFLMARLSTPGPP